MSHSEIKITVSKDQLLDTLNKNLENHKKMFKESIVGFQKFAAKTFEERLSALGRGEITNLNVSFSPPQDHTKDYERAIQMVQWHKTGSLDLTSEDFSSLVLDDWNWIGAWLASNKRFSNSTTEYANSKGF